METPVVSTPALSGSISAARFARDASMFEKSLCGMSSTKGASSGSYAYGTVTPANRLVDERVARESEDAFADLVPLDLRRAARNRHRAVHQHEHRRHRA